MKWSSIEQLYGKTLKSNPCYDMSTEGGKKRFEDFHKRVIEHVIKN
jgi:hypothetical protein